MNITRQLDGITLAKLLESGYSNLCRSVNYLNEINVFPVSDGDTGNNMKRTFELGLSDLKISDSFSDVLSSFIEGILLGSRGNSGSILSQYFLGLYENTRGIDKITVPEIAEALTAAAKTAYDAVLQPAEGTILSVMRESIAETRSVVSENAGFETFFELWSANILSGVKQTTSRLSILERNNVVDSGAAGFYLIIEGFKNALIGSSQSGEAQFQNTSAVHIQADVPNFRYCTEFTVKLNHPKDRDYYANALKPFGDSIVVSLKADLLKVHIHTNETSRVLSAFELYGQFVSTKIDDMLIQYQITEAGRNRRKHTDCVIISFLQGDGLIELFEDLGCDIVYAVNQNYEIREDNIHFFVEKFLNDNVIIIPNSKRIYSSAVSCYPPEQYENIHIIESYNAAKSYYLLSLMVATDPFEKILSDLKKSAKEKYLTLSITAAESENRVLYTCVSDECVVTGENLESVAAEFLSGHYDSAIVFAGQNAARDDNAKLEEILSARCDDYAVIDGKQDDFAYIIAAV